VILAHLPSGYILARISRRASGLPLLAALAGSVFPDLDLLWFYLVDHRAVHHHRYWFHAPGFWLIIAVLVLPVLSRAAPRYLAAGCLFFAAIFLHLILDTLAGSIMWGWPLATRLVALVEVPATQHHWILSFLTHWTFLAEIAVILWAAILFFTQAKAQDASPPVQR
jgi:hypothetical protein